MAKSLTEIHRNLLKTADFKADLELIVKNAASVLGLNTASLRLLDPASQIMEIVATCGLSKTYLQKGPVALEKSLLDKEALAGKAVTINDIASDARFQYPEEAKKEGLISLICVPLSVRGRPIGVLRAYARQVHKFSPAEGKILMTFAQQAAMAIEGARLYQRMKILAEVAREISSILDLQSVLNFVVEAAGKTFNAKGSCLRLINEKKNILELRASFGLSKEFLEKGVVETDQVIRDALAGKASFTRDAASDPRLSPREAAKVEGVHSILTVPLLLRDKIIGLLRVYLPSISEFTPEDVDFLLALASQSATAMENARLYEHVKKDYNDLMSNLSQWYGWSSPKAPR